jgi:hypothetical protein
MSKVTGYVIYEGKSELTVKNIVAVITLNSSNIKTGDMASMWILNADESLMKLVKVEATKVFVDNVCIDIFLMVVVMLHYFKHQVYKSYKKAIIH